MQNLKNMDSSIKIIDIYSPKYKAYRSMVAPKGSGRYNGAYFYSKEIRKNIIPNVKTDRNWDTLGMHGVGSLDHAIVFIHHCIIILTINIIKTFF